MSIKSWEFHYNARWYDATLGRFVTEDPARDGLNWFIYVSNNPLRWVDPTGLFELAAEDGKAIINVEEDDTLWDIIAKQNPDSSDAEILGKIDEIAETNDLEDPDKIYPGQKLEAPDSVVPDITDDLMDRMETNAEDKNTRNPFYFREKVEAGGDWDLKAQDDTVYDTTPLQYAEYLFNGEIVRYDAPGNIHYGYVGRSTWYGSRRRLLSQAGAAQIEDNPNGGWEGDDPSDAMYIIMGMDLYDNQE